MIKKNRRSKDFGLQDKGDWIQFGLPKPGTDQRSVPLQYSYYHSVHRESGVDNSIGIVTTKYAHFDVELRLESGRLLGPLTLAYETYGKLNQDASNV